MLRHPFTASTLVLVCGLILAAFPVQGQPASQQLQQPQPETLQPGLETPRQRSSYVIGYDLGSRLRADQIEVDFDGVITGIRDALQGNQPQLTQQQMMEAMQSLQQELQKKLQPQKVDSQMAADNLAKGEAFLAENRKKEGIIETPTGLQYRIIEEGEGASPVQTDTVRCHYEGTLIDGTVFDSSYKRGQPAEFPVGGVIAGWTEALQLMEVGAKWEVFLPSKIAYGASGAGGAIGPNETLIFTIELLDIVQ